MDPDTDGGAATLRRLFLRSLLAFVTAFIISTLVHEGAHAIMARALGLHPVLHHNYVQTPDNVGGAARLWVPAAGPLASLILGIACLVWVPLRSTYSAATLTVLWLGIQGTIAFFGYLMMGPLFPYGDTGKVWAVLGVPPALQWVVAIIGVTILVAVIRSTSDGFARHVIRGSRGLPRGRVANALIAGPIVAGAVVTTLLSLPAPTFLSLLYPMTSGFVAFAAYGRFRRTRAPLPQGIPDSGGVPVGQAVVLVALIGVSLALIGGVRL